MGPCLPDTLLRGAGLHEADAGVEGLLIHPQSWLKCQLPFALCLSSLGPLLVASVMWSQV